MGLPRANALAMTGLRFLLCHYEKQSDEVIPKHTRNETKSARENLARIYYAKILDYFFLLCYTNKAKRTTTYKNYSYKDTCILFCLYINQDDFDKMQIQTWCMYMRKVVVRLATNRNLRFCALTSVGALFYFAFCCQQILNSLEKAGIFVYPPFPFIMRLPHFATLRW